MLSGLKFKTLHFEYLCVSCDSNYTWDINKVRELIGVKVLHTLLQNTTVVTFKLLPLGSYAPMPAPSPPFKTILDETTRPFYQQLMDLALRQCTCSHGTVSEGVFSY